MHASKRYRQRSAVLFMSFLLSSIFLTLSEAVPMNPLDDLEDLDIDAALLAQQAIPQSDRIPWVNFDGTDNHRARPLQPWAQTGSHTGPQPGSYGFQGGQPNQPVAMRPRVETWGQQPRFLLTPLGSHGGQPGSTAHSHTQPPPHFDQTGLTLVESSPHGEMYRFPVLEYGAMQASGWGPGHTAVPATYPRGEGSSFSNKIRLRRGTRSNQDKGGTYRSANLEKEAARQNVLEMPAKESTEMQHINSVLHDAGNDAEAQQTLLELGTKFFEERSAVEAPLLYGKLDGHRNNPSTQYLAVVQGSAEQMALVRKIMELRTERLIPRKIAELQEKRRLPRSLELPPSIALAWDFEAKAVNEVLSSSHRYGYPSTGEPSPNLEPNNVLEPFLLGDFQVRFSNRDAYSSRYGVIERILLGAQSTAFVSVFAVPREVDNITHYKGKSIFVGDLHFIGAGKWFEKRAAEYAAEYRPKTALRT